nr:hypothetical protein [Nitrospirota bacterium]
MDAKPSKNPTVAGILSGLMPGLGQFYCRKWGKGAGFLVGALVIDAGLGVSEGMLSLLQGALTGASLPNSGAILLRSLPFLALAAWSIVDAVATVKACDLPSNASQTDR